MTTVQKISIIIEFESTSNDSVSDVGYDSIEQNKVFICPNESTSNDSVSDVGYDSIYSGSYGIDSGYDSGFDDIDNDDIDDYGLYYDIEIQ